MNTPPLHPLPPTPPIGSDGPSLPQQPQTPRNQLTQKADKAAAEVLPSSNEVTPGPANSPAQVPQEKSEPAVVRYLTADEARQSVGEPKKGEGLWAAASRFVRRALGFSSGSGLFELPDQEDQTSFASSDFEEAYSRGESVDGATLPRQELPTPATKQGEKAGLLSTAILAEPYAIGRRAPSWPYGEFPTPPVVASEPQTNSSTEALPPSPTTPDSSVQQHRVVLGGGDDLVMILPRKEEPAPPLSPAQSSLDQDTPRREERRSSTSSSRHTPRDDHPHLVRIPEVGMGDVTAVSPLLPAQTEAFVPPPPTPLSQEPRPISRRGITPGQSLEDEMSAPPPSPISSAQLDALRSKVAADAKADALSSQEILVELRRELLKLPGVAPQSFELRSLLRTDATSGAYVVEPYTLPGYPDEVYYRIAVTYSASIKRGNVLEEVSFTRTAFTTARTPSEAVRLATGFKATVTELALRAPAAGQDDFESFRAAAMKQRLFMLTPVTSKETGRLLPGAPFDVKFETTPQGSNKPVSQKYRLNVQKREEAARGQRAPHLLADVHSQLKQPPVMDEEAYMLERGIKIELASLFTGADCSVKMQGAAAALKNEIAKKENEFAAAKARFIDASGKSWLEWFVKRENKQLYKTTDRLEKAIHDDVVYRAILECGAAGRPLPDGVVSDASMAKCSPDLQAFVRMKVENEAVRARVDELRKLQGEMLDPNVREDDNAKDVLLNKLKVAALYDSAMETKSFDELKAEALKLFKREITDHLKTIQSIGGDLDLAQLKVSDGIGFVRENFSHLLQLERELAQISAVARELEGEARQAQLAAQTPEIRQEFARFANEMAQVSRDGASKESEREKVIDAIDTLLGGFGGRISAVTDVQVGPANDSITSADGFGENDSITSAP